MSYKMEVNQSSFSSVEPNVSSLLLVFIIFRITLVICRVKLKQNILPTNLHQFTVEFRFKVTSFLCLYSFRQLLAVLLNYLKNTSFSQTTNLHILNIQCNNCNRQCAIYLTSKNPNRMHALTKSQYYYCNIHAG